MTDSKDRQIAVLCSQRNAAHDQLASVTAQLMGARQQIGELTAELRELKADKTPPEKEKPNGHQRASA